MASEKKAPPADERLDTSGDLEATARLLHEVFAEPRFADTRYLEWFYRKNPAGLAIETDVADASGRMGHIGGIPGTFHSLSGTVQTTFPLNVAVAERARGKGALGRVTGAHWQQAFARFEHAVALGMANANSTHYYEKRDGYRVVMPLPVIVCPPVWPSLAPATTVHVDEAYLASPAFERFVESLDLAPTTAWSAKWTVPQLRWRLSRPGAGYALHVAGHAAVVSRLDRRKGIPFTIVMKTFRLKSATRPRVIANAAIAAACQSRLTPVAVYAGFSATCRVIGTPLPEKLKPAPLNLCVKSLRPGYIDPAAWRYDTWEFLDFDVY